MSRILNLLDALDERVPGSHPERRTLIGIPWMLALLALLIVVTVVQSRYGGWWSLLVVAVVLLVEIPVRRWVQRRNA